MQIYCIWMNKWNVQSSYRQRAQICRVVKLQAHFKKKKSVNCCDWWQIFLLGLHNDSHFPSGTLGFSFHDATNTLKLSTSSTTDLLRRTQTGKQTGNQPNGAALVWRLLAGLRRSDVSDGPSLPSAWRCTETLPSPLWPSSWRWGRRDCPEAACGPHLRPASAHRTDGQMQSDNSLMRGTLKTQCVEVLCEYGSFQRNLRAFFVCWMWQLWLKRVEVRWDVCMVCGHWCHGVVNV